MDIDTAFLSVGELAAGYRSGAFTPLDVCRQAHERLARLEPDLNAFIEPMAEDVFDQATRATEELRQGLDRGPLHGIPVAIKDIIDVADVRTTFATKAVPPKHATRDAECVARLRAAGAIIFGKTNLLEFAAGQTNNPHDPNRTAGGSSGGSAAAVAAGIVPLSLGTDTGGSIRAPAAYCGIVGFKPSFAALSLEGVYPLSPSLDHLGLFARSSADATIAFAALHPDAASARPRQGPLRLGMVGNQWNHRAVRADVRAALDTARLSLERAGVALTEIQLPGPAEMAAALLDILMPEAAVVHGSKMVTNADGFAKGTRDLLEAGMRVQATRYIEAMEKQHRWFSEFETAMADLDAVIAPTVPFTAPDTDPALSTDGDDEIISLTHANLTGAPSISLPLFNYGAMPVGLMVTAARKGDNDLLSICETIERVLSHRS
ncbi:amidase [Shinella sp.]|uniref:amidase n=1 Tax=Shinella sp. TaxID=1870904 RepID=UPI0028A23B1F|nr:amidase [Shinella sp.]